MGTEAVPDGVVAAAREAAAGADTTITDWDVLASLEPAVQEWWVDAFGEYIDENRGFFTPPQEGAIPHVHDDEHALVAAPTGTGKTLAAHTAILDELFRRERADGLENSVYCLYVSPLRALANDIHRNLSVPLEGIRERMADRGQPVSEVRHAIRHGDTDDEERRRMLRETPHILNTTPETLAILLNAPSFREKLRTVEYVIVDEIHALADSKRGTHLAVSLERLENLTESSPTRIGCSATIEPLDEMADFLVGQATPGGPARDRAIVDARDVRSFDLKLECPVDDLLAAPAGAVRDGLYDRLNELITGHDTTIVFTNTRSGAERVLHQLRERFDGYDESTSGAHHGSLSSTRRQAVEEGLKDGTLDIVTTSTSLELGVDMPDVDLVVQIGSPKSVAALLQRVGRAGHGVGRTVEGRVIVLDRDELVECAVMLDRAREGFVDRVHIPKGPQDVAAQHVYGMAIARIRPEREVLGTLQRAYPYRHYGDAEFERLCRYLTADYEGMEDRNAYAKIWRDENDPPGGRHHHEEFPVGERLIGKRGRQARAIYMTNIGTIPDSFTVTVKTRGEGDRVGDLDESYLDTLSPGDVFVLGGDHYEYRYRRGATVYVDPTTERPTVPSWFSERLPLSTDLGREILAFQSAVCERLDHGGTTRLRGWLSEFPIDAAAAKSLVRTYVEQEQYLGIESIATDERLPVEVCLDREEYRRHYYVHSVYGRRVNDGLSRLVAYHCSRRVNADIAVAVADHGFVVSMPLNRKVDVAEVLASIDPEEVRDDLRAALRDTDLLQRYFRIDAVRSLLLLKRYKGYEKSAAEQQVSSEMLLGWAHDLEDFAVLEETYRELLEDKLAVEDIVGILRAIRDGEIAVTSHRVQSPSPRAFGLATLAASDVVLAEDEDQVLREFHERVLEAIEAD